jgi:hypothetical protein
MRERDEAAVQPGAALFLRRVPVADEATELFQIGRGPVTLRDHGGPRVEQDASAEYTIKRFDSVGARYRDKS